MIRSNSSRPGLLHRQFRMRMDVFIDGLEFWKQCGETCKDSCRLVRAHESNPLTSDRHRVDLVAIAVVRVGDFQKGNPSGCETDVTCAASPDPATVAVRHL